MIVKRNLFCFNRFLYLARILKFQRLRKKMSTSILRMHFLALLMNVTQEVIDVAIRNLLLYYRFSISTCQVRFFDFHFFLKFFTYTIARSISVLKNYLIIRDSYSAYMLVEYSVDICMKYIRF